MSDDGGKAEGGDYTPIACGLYSEYEVAILHRQPLHLHWHDDKGLDHVECVVPKDLQIRNHCEYLIAENSEGATREIRLDRILSHEQESK